MPEAVQEISIYIHRFHNLDLFQQGWYQIKVDTRWEDSEGSASGIPTRVAQYDVPNSDSDVTMGVWQINDSDHSFGTQPFQIRYARQDVYLSVMVSFSLDVTVTEHRIEILEYLRRVWAEDRSTEWSMWLVHSIKLQQNETTYGDAEEDSHYLHFAKEALPRKSNEDPAMVAASCAELHRRGIEQMKINNRFLQDLQLFGSSSQAPVIYVERHIIQGQVSSSVKDAFSLSFSGSLEKDGSATVPKAAKESLPPKMTNLSMVFRLVQSIDP